MLIEGGDDMFLFTQIPDKIKYPPNIRAKLSTLHSAVIDYVIAHPEVYKGTQQSKNQLLSIINSLSYYLYNQESLPSDWSVSDPLKLTTVPDGICRSLPSTLYINSKHVDWQELVPVVQESAVTDRVDLHPTSNSSVVDTFVPDPMDLPTSKEDLYMKPPTIPRFSTTDVWAAGIIAGEKYCVYKSLPEIPTKQNEISLTTDVNKMQPAELMKLFPNRFIPTRSSSMYQEVPGLEFHGQLGLILPIEGYTWNELLDNVIKYPHFYRLMKCVDNNLESFYSTIEIEGQLYNTLDIWDELPESKIIPKGAEFIKEYVIRRYLLERDVKHMQHRYCIYGSLDPFITLFMPPSDYADYGYCDAIALAKQCVESRVAFKRTRNPILRRLDNV